MDLDRVVAQARAARERRERDYREQALKLYPWVCGRCAREFTRANLQELTVHHRDHDHDRNPPDGSNWELLCVYCHEQEHVKHEDAARYGVTAAQDPRAPSACHKPFAALGDLLKPRR